MADTAVLHGGIEVAPQATHHFTQNSAAQAGSYPLHVAQECRPVRICKVRGKDDTRRFLAELGFVEGSEVSVVCENAGNIIADVKGARVALSPQMAGRIMVCDA